MAQVKSYRYAVVDVFTAEPLAGNPLAVFPDASEFDETTMQKIARELNLAETAFVLPATREDCVARVRIFTPAKELAFAGHPSIGTAFVLFQEETISRNSSEFSLGEEVGPIPIRIEGGQRPLIFSDVCAGIRRSRGSGDRKLNRTFGSFHDAPPLYLESWGHPTKLESRSWFNSFR